MFRKMHRFHRWDFGTENHVLLYPKKHVFRESEDPELSGDGWHAAYAVLHHIQDSKKILIWRAYVVLFHQNLLQLKRFQAPLDKIVVNQGKNLQAFQDSFFRYKFILILSDMKSRIHTFIPKYAEEPRSSGTAVLPHKNIQAT